MNAKKLDCYEYIRAINFGDIDGMYDPNLDSYFLDRNYLSNILYSPKYFVIGRKGTGKSALYSWLHNRSFDNGSLCSNITLNDFPFEKLLKLKDEGFPRPHQYQTICRNMILNELAKLIVNDNNHENNDLYDKLKNYIDKALGTSFDDCFRRTVQQAKQTNGSISIKGVGLFKSNEESETYEYHNDEEMYRVNSLLQDTIVSYLISYHQCDKSHFLLQIDGLDENYNQIMTNSDRAGDYLQFLVSLMKANYAINQTIHQRCNDIARSIIYIRSDIFNLIHGYDSESARWEQYSETLSWVIEGHRWMNNDLRKLINQRISTSISDLSEKDGFSIVFDYKAIDLRRYNNTQNQYIFEYVVNRGFHRPRDVIQFCIKIQEACTKEGTLNFKAFNIAEKEYSLWFLSEITNEISPKIKNTNDLFAFLRTLGAKPISLSTFKSKYEKYQKNIGFTSQQLLEYLYETGIISNINDKGEWFSIIRNSKSKLNPDIKIILHPGFWKGLYTSTF